MSKLFDEGHRTLQRQFDTERLADRIEERLCRDHVNPEDRAFIERLDMFFLATVDERGRPSCSYKGGDPGFVRVLDEHTLVFPSFDGNGMFLSAGNLSANPQVGLLFIDFLAPKRLRLGGRARLGAPTAVNPAYPKAQFVIFVDVREVFPNCPRYVHKLESIERSAFVPKHGVQTPEPGWKQAEWARDVLPERGPGHE